MGHNGPLWPIWLNGNTDGVSGDATCFRMENMWRSMGKSGQGWERMEKDDIE